MATFLHSGDLGDAIYALPSIRALGGGELYFASRPWTRTRWGNQLLALIKPLIDATGYCEAHLHDGEWIDYDISTFRSGGYKLGDTIMERQRRWVGAEQWDGKPWLKAEAMQKAPIVINRATRWHGFHFPWKRVVEAFDPKKILFIGLEGEHKAFEKEYRVTVAFHACGDLLEAASIIKGSEIFIGNQSACNACANGLGAASVVEVCSYASDCFLKRENAKYSFNGEVKFSACGKDFECEGFEGRFETEVGGRILRSDDPDKLKVIARSVHAHDGTFAFYDEVPVH